MGSISYLVELRTEFPITVDEEDFKQERSFFEVILPKLQDCMEDFDMNERPFAVVVISETREQVDD